MKTCKIIRVTKGNEEAGAREVADYFNKQKKAGTSTGRAVVTAAGEDMVYTIFGDGPDVSDDDKKDEDMQDADADEPGEASDTKEDWEQHFTK